MRFRFVAVMSAMAALVSTDASPGVAQSTSRPTLRQIDDNYLLSAHLGAGLLHVIDLRTNAVVKTVPDVPGVEGVAYIADGKKVYTANWGSFCSVPRQAVARPLTGTRLTQPLDLPLRGR